MSGQLAQMVSFFIVKEGEGVRACSYAVMPRLRS